MTESVILTHYNLLSPPPSTSSLPSPSLPFLSSLATHSDYNNPL